MKLMYQGFDGFDVSFQGMIPASIREQLEYARESAQNKRNIETTFLGFNHIPVHVAESGSRGGYKYRFDTGPDREIWFIADSDKSDKWNIRVSVKSLSLALYGYEGVKRNILNFLKDVGAKGVKEDFSLLESISRVDYCFDFITDNFKINPEFIQSHSRSTHKLNGNQVLIARNRDIETATIGKMPNRQICFYNKLKEVKGNPNKDYWWDVWNLDKAEFNKKIYRVEIRAGKKELQAWNIRTFSEFEKKIADVFEDIANSIRYVKPNYKDSNRSRWENKEFWNELLAAIKNNLFHFSTNAKKEKIIYAFRTSKAIEYRNLFANLVPPYMVVTGRKPEELSFVLDELKSEIETNFRQSRDIFLDKYEAAKGKYIFLD